MQRFALSRFSGRKGFFPSYFGSVVFGKFCPLAYQKKKKETTFL